MNIRTFTADQLDAWHLPEPDSIWGDQAPTILDTDVVHMGDHTCTKTLVFRAPDDGRHYRIRYEMALADGNYTDPWFDETTVDGIEVVQRPVTVMTWQPVGQDTPA